MKNSYKSILDDQVNQHRMHKDIQIMERQSQAAISAQKIQLNR